MLTEDHALALARKVTKAITTTPFHIIPKLIQFTTELECACDVTFPASKEKTNGFTLKMHPLYDFLPDDWQFALKKDDLYALENPLVENLIEIFPHKEFSLQVEGSYLALANWIWPEVWEPEDLEKIRVEISFLRGESVYFFCEEHTFSLRDLLAPAVVQELYQEFARILQEAELPTEEESAKQREREFFFGK